MKGKFHHNYTKLVVNEQDQPVIDPQTGKQARKTIFVYGVTGTTEELEQFSGIQGSFLKHIDDDVTKPYCWFSPNFLGNIVTLKFSRDGKAVYGDDSAKLKVINVIQTWGPIVGTAMGTAVANKLLEGIDFGSTEEIDAPIPQTAPKGDKADLSELGG